MWIMAFFDSFLVQSALSSQEALAAEVGGGCGVLISYELSVHPDREANRQSGEPEV